MTNVTAKGCLCGSSMWKIARKWPPSHNLSLDWTAKILNNRSSLRELIVCRRREIPFLSILFSHFTYSWPIFIYLFIGQLVKGKKGMDKGISSKTWKFLTHAASYISPIYIYEYISQACGKDNVTKNNCRRLTRWRVLVGLFIPWWIPQQSAFGCTH